MKKFLSFVFALLLSVSVNAQTTLTEAVDFESTSHEGVEIKLFEILDGGQYVVIDFFFTTCGPCNESVPRIVEAYQELGGNEGDFYFMEVSPTDHKKSAGSWIEKYNVPYPTIHSETAGDTGEKICELYDIGAFPTLILIAPDRKILYNDYWPESVDKMLADFNSRKESHVLALDEMTSGDFMLYPNPASSEIKIITDMNGEADVNIYDMTGRRVKDIRVSDASKATIDISDIEKGVYLININGKIERFVRI